MIRYGFEILDLNRIEARSNDNNIASVNVMNNVGMQYEGTLRQDRIIKSVIRNTRVYSILKEEYFSRLDVGSYIS
ncbi:hypothetical protein D3C71_1805010 [compost metagenome]